MAVHVVGFTDIVRFEGDTPIFKGREMLHEYYDTAAYKALKPGDSEVAHRTRPDITNDFVEAKPFSADLTISTEHSIPGPYVTLYHAKMDTYYPMFYLDFITMAAQAIIIRGRVTGSFGYVKKNKNFGIIYRGKE
jgi:hypothetical protein